MKDIIHKQKNIRINKYLADKGVASRREIDTLIEGGEIKVNGKKAVLGQMITPSDNVQLIRKRDVVKKYYAYYKGRGILTHKTKENDDDIEKQLTARGLNGVYPVGRLDKDSEGLLILTNDGRVTKPLLEPQFEHEKEYFVTVDKKVTKHLLKKLEIGVHIENYHTKKAKTIAHKDLTFFIILKEGKKHQIRRMCAALGYQVKALKRIRIGSITLGALKPNQYRSIKGEELANFLTSLGIKSD